MESKLSEFMFNIETLKMLSSCDWSKEKILENMEKINLNQEIVNLVLDNESLLNSVLLRLQIDKDHSRSNVSNTFKSLNNPGLDSLVEYLFVNDNLVYQNNDANEIDQVNNDSEESESSEIDTNVLLDKFLSECVQQTDNSDQTVKLNEFYNQLNTWWENLYDSEVPDKKELKTFLTTNLGKSSKSSWYGVNLKC